MIACADVREAIAILLFVSSACGTPSSQTVDSTSTGSETSAGPIEELTSSTTSSASSASSSSSSGAEGSSGSSGIGLPDLPDPDPDPPQASEYCESIVDSFCDFYLRCGRMDVASVDLCREPFLASCNTVFEPQYVALEAAGLLTLSAEGLLACEEHLGVVACEAQIFELTGPCSGLWSGTQGVGEGCGLDVEYYVCDPSAACTIGLDFCGTCETLLAVGDDCTTEASTCGPEAFCDAGACRARVPNGETCTPDDRCMAGSGCIDALCQGPTFVALGDACGATARCPYLTACVGGVCTSTVGVGEACSASAPCEIGLCAGGVCVAPRDDGEACGGNAGCSSGMCIEGMCEPRPSGCVAG